MSGVKKRVLVVEDNLMNKILVKEILSVHGYEIIEASNGKEAIETIKKVNPDVVLMDINLPVMDGVTATKILKEDKATRAIPVIALTASAMRGDDERFLSEGFDGYVQKPIEIKALIGQLAICLEKRSQ